MREEDLDIVEFIIQNMPEETDEQMKIKLYMQMNKSNCNHFIYSYFEREVSLFNSTFKMLKADLGREIHKVLVRKGEI